MKYALVQYYTQHASTRADVLWCEVDTEDEALSKARDLMIAWGWSDEQIEKMHDGDCGLLVVSNKDLGVDHDDGHFELIDPRNPATGQREIHFVEN